MAVKLCALEIPSLAWRLEARIHGVPAELAAQFAKRWPTLPARAARADASIDLAISAEPVGYPASPLVGAQVEHQDAERAVLVTNGARVELAWDGAALGGEGRLHVPHAIGALESIFRAVAVLSLARRGFALLHAAAVCDGRDGVLLLGGSSAGKTTTARRLGREGLRRLADDMIMVDLSGEAPALYPVPFERGGRPLRHVPGELCVCRAAVLVRKGANRAAIAPCTDAVRLWGDARVALPPRPGDEAATLDVFARLCRIPAALLDAPASGPLAPAVRSWLRAAAQLEGAPGPGRAAKTPPAPASGSKRPPAAPTAQMNVPPKSPQTGATQAGTRIERAPNVAWRVLDGAAVLVAPGSPTVRTLNPVGTKVWELADGRSLGEIVQAVVNEFEVTDTQAEDDVQRFVKDLAEKGLLVMRLP